MMSLLKKAAARIGASLVVATMLMGAAGADSSPTLDRIKSKGEVRLAYRDDAAPFSYTISGAPVGYSIDLCLAVVNSLKEQLKLSSLKATFVPVTAETRFSAIEKGEADLLCEATTATLSRRESVDFSIPTFVSGASLLIQPGGPASFEQMTGKKIGVLGGTTTQQGLESFLREKNLKVDVVVVKSHPEGFKALEDGTIAAYFGDRTILQYFLIKDRPGSTLMLADSFLSVEPYALALPLHDDGFRLAVDRGLSRLFREGNVGAIFEKSFGQGAKPSNLLSALYLIDGLPE